MDVIDSPLGDSYVATVGVKSVLTRKGSWGSSQPGGSPHSFLPQALGIGTAGKGAGNGEAQWLGRGVIESRVCGDILGVISQLCYRKELPGHQG